MFPRRLWVSTTSAPAPEVWRNAPRIDEQRGFLRTATTRDAMIASRFPNNLPFGPGTVE
jgi:hypothetical protein